jgi:nitroimidazol reductase NimA-like FMN-containing flavoprotein (pyridoxamine 5'-phosphate oxidase superfamily)
MLIQELSREECLTLLKSTRLYRLGCVQENQPYIVPVNLVFGESTLGEPCFYGFSGPGKKIDWMSANSLVCVECDDVTSRTQWTSVVVSGRYEELPDAPHYQQERVHAHELLLQYTDWWEPASATHVARGPNRLMRRLYYRIRINEMTGRRAVPGPAA